MKKYIQYLMVFFMVIFSVNTYAGVIGLMTLSAADNAQQAAQQALKNSGSKVEVSTGPNSVMCDYSDGFCVAQNTREVNYLKNIYNISYFNGSYCNPAEYVAAYLGHTPKKITKITYVYLGQKEAVIEFEP
jgi:hypothetical protein